jgi:hypothetical protein
MYTEMSRKVKGIKSQIEVQKIANPDANGIKQEEISVIDFPDRGKALRELDKYVMEFIKRF